MDAGGLNSPPDGTSLGADARIGHSASTYFKGERAMSIRLSRLATGVLVVAAMVLMSGLSWAMFYGLGPSKDEWKLKYDVEVDAASGDTLTVDFTLADEGRLKPIYSITLIAFSKQTDSQGGRSYDVKAPIQLKATTDGKRAGQAQIRKEFADRAIIRILTQTVDGRPQQFAAYYDIPLRKFLNKVPAAASRQAPRSIAAPPASKVTK
jgi:hypothetical protein